jgi:hypothetical protein
MNWQERLITIYLYVCKQYQEKLWVYSQRMSNYADRHLRSWFPRFPSYVAYVQRLNRLADVFAPLIGYSSTRANARKWPSNLVNRFLSRDPSQTGTSL